MIFMCMIVIGIVVIIVVNFIQPKEETEEEEAGSSSTGGVVSAVRRILVDRTAEAIAAQVRAPIDRPRPAASSQTERS